MKKHLTITNLFWTIYILLLAVLLPHTAWAFGRHQGGSEWAQNAMAWALALAFEAAIFAFTHQLKGRIERSHKLRRSTDEIWLHFTWRKFSSAYLNIFSLGLILCSSVSVLANFSYAVEFAAGFETFSRYSFNPLLYELGFGGILPVASFLFARVLADTVDGEGQEPGFGGSKEG